MTVETEKNRKHLEFREHVNLHTEQGRTRPSKGEFTFFVVNIVGFFLSWNNRLKFLRSLRFVRVVLVVASSPIAVGELPNTKAPLRYLTIIYFPV